MSKKADLGNALGMAFGFLTILPIPQRKEWSDTDFGWSAVFYPLTGAVIGAAAGGAYLLLTGVFGKSIAAFLTLIIWILLSGGLHWDGLGDCFDGFFCSAAPERRLKIMKDSRLGTYGVLGIFCSLILKWLCLWNLPDRTNTVLLSALVSSAARWGMLFLTRMPLVNPNGLAAMLKKDCPKLAPLFAAPVPMVLAFICRVDGLICLAAALVTTGLIGLLAKAKIGGINGDVLGFCIETAEIMMLLALQVML